MSPEEQVREILGTVEAEVTRMLGHSPRRMPRETVESKALRLLAERRLTVTLVDHERVEAACRGTDAIHQLGYRRGGWWCDCEAHEHGRRCSHLAALQCVTIRPSRDRRRA